MSFCSFTKEFNKYTSTDIDNKFITSYLPEASGNAVKVYLYGLLACKDADESLTLGKFSENLKLDEDEVKDCFKFWEEWGLLNVISEDPFLVKYLPVSSDKPKKINVEKYGEFNKALQALIPERMITTSEYTAYFNLMEDFSLPPEAMLMIVKYCVDIKGEAIGFRYILKVASDFCQRGLNTVAKIEKELSDYTLRQGEFAGIVAAVSPNKKPEVEDLNLYKKWTEDYSFSPDAVLFTAKKTKVKSMAKLDKELSSLYSAKKISVEEIGNYYSEKNKTTETARKIARALSLYVEIIDPVVENYVTPWMNMGYDEETLIFIANFCFRKNRRTLEDMNELVSGLYKNGLITIMSIAEYIKSATADDGFIKTLLADAGLSRKPTDWDRRNLKAWRGWNFSDEMIEEAAKISAGKSNPMSYVNAVLSGWKAQNIFTPDKITVYSKSAGGKMANSHNYSKEQLDDLIDNIEDIEF